MITPSVHFLAFLTYLLTCLYIGFLFWRDDYDLDEEDTTWSKARAQFMDTGLFSARTVSIILPIIMYAPPFCFGALYYTVAADLEACWLMIREALTPAKKIIYGCDGRGDGQQPYLTRYTLIDRPDWQLCLHVFHRSDYPDFHDHPWSFYTFILWRGYWENTPDGKRTRINPLRLLFRPATHTHWVELVSDPAYPESGPDKPAVTLVLMGKRVREWGFWLNGQWIQWQAYFQQKRC